MLASVGFMFLIAHYAVAEPLWFLLGRTNSLLVLDTYWFSLLHSRNKFSMAKKKKYFAFVALSRLSLPYSDCHCLILDLMAFSRLLLPRSGCYLLTIALVIVLFS